MAAYFQMGHDTENLIGERDLDEFKGIILSPVNRVSIELQNHITNFRAQGNYDIVLDPQLYFPDTERGKLRQQPYFPSDFDTADMTSLLWWDNIITPLAKFARQLKVDAVTSPVIQPKVWDDDYFAMCVDVSDRLSLELNNEKIRVLTTIMLNIDQMNTESTGLRIASIMSRAKSAGYYIVFVTESEPRRELSDANQLFNIMKFIEILQPAIKEILISNCSSDMLLYKSAGASNCATGKFFNLRRYTSSRFRDPIEGGGQLPYWFEHSCLSFFREADILRLHRDGYGNLLRELYSNNYWASAILAQFQSNPGQPWLALSWRQYLSWFGKAELALSQGNAQQMVDQWLITAENNWLTLDNNHILLEEPRNNGSWIRPWRQALNDFIRRR